MREPLHGGAREAGADLRAIDVGHRGDEVGVVHVPSFDVWVDASLGLDGYSLEGDHDTRATHFAGPLRSIAEAGLGDLPRGAKLRIAGYSSLRRDGSGNWHVGFRSSCPDKGLPCDFRDGRGAAEITAVTLPSCDVSGFSYSL